MDQLQMSLQHRMQNRASSESPGLQQPSMEHQHVCQTLIDGNHEDVQLRIRDDVVALNGHQDDDEDGA